MHISGLCMFPFPPLFRLMLGTLLVDYYGSKYPPESCLLTVSRHWSTPIINGNTASNNDNICYLPPYRVSSSRFCITHSSTWFWSIYDATCLLLVFLSLSLSVSFSSAVFRFISVCVRCAGRDNPGPGREELNLPVDRKLWALNTFLGVKPRDLLSSVIFKFLNGMFSGSYILTQENQFI